MALSICSEVAFISSTEEAVCSDAADISSVVAEISSILLLSSSISELITSSTLLTLIDSSETSFIIPDTDFRMVSIALARTPVSSFFFKSFGDTSIVRSPSDTIFK